ncbi:MAG: NAD(P)/FAD-dependent oxidoreductase [Candidatus Paceibacteria bacterium]
MLKVYDVVVIGGGPAGMMAAATASRRGKKVLLLEKNKTLGVKLLITGGGRCNVTNNKSDKRKLAVMYGEAGKFLHSTFAQHAVEETIAYFKQLGVEFKEENEGRLFPSTNTAKTIFDALVKDMKQAGVEVCCGYSVTNIEPLKTGGFLVQTKAKDEIKVATCILATGGKARPETGSTGDGFNWLGQLGHTVTEDTRGLVPLRSSDAWIPALGGVTLSDVGISVCVDGKVESKKRGKLLFTHTGVSGPGVLQISQMVGELLPAGTVSLALDLLPDLDHATLRIQLQTLLVNESNKKLKNILSTLIPTALVAPLLVQLKIDGETPAHSVRSVDRNTLVSGLKVLVVTISALHGLEKAVVAGGGVSLKEVDFKTMQSRLVPGLYIVGDVLNINRPSGGYSLQLCWSTGYVAGVSV